MIEYGNKGKIMKREKYQLGMIGLGVMGQNLVMNMGNNGFSVLGFDKNAKKVNELNTKAGDLNVNGVEKLEQFIQLLEIPRNIMLMVPAGPPVDAVIGDLLNHLDPGDLIIDGGNSYYKDTELRADTLSEKGIHYLGVGISGGESGALHGPSIMPGGPLKVYQRVQPILESIAAKVDGEPCVTYLGPKGAGHYVKMVHNGIEYGLMELIAETYDLMKRGVGLDDSQLHSIYQWWNQMETNGYLLEITANIFSNFDKKTGKRLIDVILDEANQKGTGQWTAEDAMDLDVPVPSIDIAVAMRNLSTYKDQREAASKTLKNGKPKFTGDQEQFIDSLRMALYAGMIITFSQGFSQLRSASDTYGYRLNLNSIAQIWRGGCIIRAALLNEIKTAYNRQPDLPNLLLDPQLGEDVMRLRESLKTVVCQAAELGIPAPGFMASLAYLDSYRSDWLPANLIQAQRDYFGAHTYERIDTKGVFHHQWSPNI
jgi:6-phosphogluconate dehydrogenase